MNHILVMGAYGFLGTVLCANLGAAGYRVSRQGRKTGAEFAIDPTEKADVARLLDITQPSVIVNLNAMTNVDACEQDVQAAYQANVRTVEVLVHVLEKVGGHLIQLSTDQLYDGPGPHTEEEVNPCNVYGLSKYAGELVAGRVGATVLRTNFVGRSQAAGRVTFSDWLVSSLRERRPITLFNDVHFSALHTSALCWAIERAAILRPVGVWNVGCVDSLSKANFALELARRLDLDVSSVTIGRSSDINLQARRPVDMTLDVSSSAESLQISAPTMQQTLDRVAGDYLGSNQ